MRLRPILLLAIGARLSTAQAADTPRRLPGATVAGVVVDSFAHSALVGATVQLVDADSVARFGRTAISDSVGRFAFADVPDGRYILGFFHPMLDSLGVAPPMHEVVVVGHRSAHVDLSVPSPARIRTAICATSPSTDSGAVVVGVVRDARGRAPASGVTVTGEWREVFFTPDGIGGRVAHRIATTGDDGWFALCNVPSAGSMALTASRSADSTDRIDVQLPVERFVRRDLYLGPTRTVIAASGRLQGTVITVADGQPLPGALVNISGGAPVRANERGEWTLMDAPLGTRMLEVRAVGYYPERRAADVVADAAPVRVSLFTLKAMLDTVKVTAARLRYGMDRTGFDQRRRSGGGNYMTDEQIGRFHTALTSELLRRMPGVRIEKDSTATEQQILMRSAFVTDAAAGQRDFGKTWCAPMFFLDGHNLSHLTAADVDTWVRPKEIAGIEIYSEASIPVQFHWGISECGAILIWTKRPVSH